MRGEAQGSSPLINEDKLCHKCPRSGTLWPEAHLTSLCAYERKVIMHKLQYLLNFDVSKNIYM